MEARRRFGDETTYIVNMEQHGVAAGRISTAVPGRFGDSVRVTHAVFSRGNGRALPTRPLLLCVHGWGSNESDLADMMRYIAPHNDYASLRAPFVLQAPGDGGLGSMAGAYSWFHDSVPIGDDLDRDIFAAATAIDDWVRDHVRAEREVVPVGFSQGGALAVHLLRIHPERYRAVISLSGFLAPAGVPGSAPADDRLADLEIPAFYGYGDRDTVIPKPEAYAFAAWLEDHTWLRANQYHGLDHAVNLEEFSDIRQWLLLHNIASGVM